VITFKDVLQTIHEKARNVRPTIVAVDVWIDIINSERDNVDIFLIIDSVFAEVQRRSRPV